MCVEYFLFIFVKPDKIQVFFYVQNLTPFKNKAKVVKKYENF